MTTEGIEIEEYFYTYMEKIYFNHQTLFPVMHVTVCMELVV